MLSRCVRWTGLRSGGSGMMAPTASSGATTAASQPSRRARTTATVTQHGGRAVVKDLWILRHGQATHNPRAEAARANGCSHEEFLELMRQDDSLDAALTPLGRSQAEAVWKEHGQKYWRAPSTDDDDDNNNTNNTPSASHTPALVVSSPLSRTIHTADLACPVCANRVAYEGIREIHGWLRNAQRETKSTLQQRHADWNWDDLVDDQDTLWTPHLEDTRACGERGVRALEWLSERPEASILLVAHGGILRFTMSEHPRVRVRDERRRRSEDVGADGAIRDVHARFGNCELRRYRLEVDHDGESGDIVMIEVDLDADWVERTN